jgi:AcrR family transcriptional regulator
VRIARENVRGKILEAAERRLFHYGFKKTTIDEIAADAGVGKGTVYLYFDSKEDICLTIVAGYKAGVIHKQQEILKNRDMDTVEKIRSFLLLPLVTSHDRCDSYPDAIDLIVALKPHLADHMRPYFEEEIELLAKILDEGNERGVTVVDDTKATARTMKIMTMGLFPPYPCVTGRETIEHECEMIIELVMRGLARIDGQLVGLGG